MNVSDGPYSLGKGGRGLNALIYDLPIFFLKNLLIYTFPKDCNAFVFTLFYGLDGDLE